MTTVLHTMGTR